MDLGYLLDPFYQCDLSGNNRQGLLVDTAAEKDVYDRYPYGGVNYLDNGFYRKNL